MAKRCKLCTLTFQTSRLNFWKQKTELARRNIGQHHTKPKNKILFTFQVKQSHEKIRAFLVTFTFLLKVVSDAKRNQFAIQLPHEQLSDFRQLTQSWFDDWNSSKRSTSHFGNQFFLRKRVFLRRLVLTIYATRTNKQHISEILYISTYLCPSFLIFGVLVHEK